MPIGKHSLNIGFLEGMGVGGSRRIAMGQTACLSPSWLLSQIITDQVAYKQDKFISHSSGSL